MSECDLETSTMRRPRSTGAVGRWGGGGGGEKLDEKKRITHAEQPGSIEICFILFLSTIFLETANIYSLVN